MSRRPSNRRCDMPGCKRKHYARGVCKAHYQVYLRYGSPTLGRQKCAVRGCRVKTRLTICSMHQHRAKLGLPHFPLEKGKRISGSKHYRWRGGVGRMGYKRIRAYIMLQKPTCPECGKPATHIAFADGNRENITPSNLLPMCAKHANNYRRMLKGEGTYDGLR